MPAQDLINAYVSHLRELSRTVRTIHTYTRTLTIMDRELPYGLDCANETELKQWLWRDGLAPASRAVYYAAVKGFFSWAVKDAQILDHDPTQRIRRPKVLTGSPRVASDEQVHEVLTRSWDPYRTWALLAAYAGLRCVEVFRLHREHVTDRKLIVMRGKGEKPRQLPTHPLIWETVEPLPAGPIVTQGRDERDLSNSFLLHCQRRLDVDVSMHKLRGWWATNTYRITKDIRAVQKGMGHANPGTTAGYIDVTDSELQAMVMGLPDLTRKITHRAS